MSTCSFPTFLVCVLLFLKRGQSQDVLRLQFLVAQESDDNRVYHNDATIPAAMMAVDDINNNPNYLPNYQLTIEFSDTRVSTHIC